MSGGGRAGESSSSDFCNFCARLQVLHTAKTHRTLQEGVRGKRKTLVPPTQTSGGALHTASNSGVSESVSHSVMAAVQPQLRLCEPIRTAAATPSASTHTGTAATVQERVKKTIVDVWLGS